MLRKKLKCAIFIEGQYGSSCVTFGNKVKLVKDDYMVDSIYRPYVFDSDRNISKIKSCLLDDSIGSSGVSIALLTKTMNRGKGVSLADMYIYMLYWTMFAISFHGSPYKNNFVLKDSLDKAMFRKVYDCGDAQSNDSKE